MTCIDARCRQGLWLCGRGTARSTADRFQGRSELRAAHGLPTAAAISSGVGGPVHPRSSCPSHRSPRSMSPSTTHRGRRTDYAGDMGRFPVALRGPRAMSRPCSFAEASCEHGREAVPIFGTVRFRIIVSCGSDRRPAGRRSAASANRLGRAANRSGPKDARRAAERGLLASSATSRRKSASVATLNGGDGLPEAAPSNR